MKYKNPVLRGMYPDPSVCKKDDKYYMVCSSFQYFPAVPLFESEDMINWQQIGHCLTRKSQIDLSEATSSGGIFAPTIRVNENRFYMVTTNATTHENFYVYTDDIYGEWSEPIRVEQDGIDPSLYFEDGRTYFISNGEDEQNKSCIRMCEIDIATGKKLSETKPLWYGTGGRFIEAPHLYKFGEYYYILNAEGGTEYGHMVNYARSKDMWGPFEPFAGNPALTNRNLGGYLLQGAGHGDLIEDKAGNWWFIHLGFRQIDRWLTFHHLGRECCLVPVSFEDSWFYIGDGTSKLEYDLPHITANEQVLNFKKTFEDLVLSKDWCFIKAYDEMQYEFGTNYLKIKAGKETLLGSGRPTFAAVRQNEFKETICCDLQSECKEAGLTLYMDEKHHYDLYLDEMGKVHLRVVIGGMVHEMKNFEANYQKVTLHIDADELSYKFSVLSDGQFNDMGSVDTRYLSSEVAGGFTGVMIGLYAVDDQEKEALFTNLSLEHAED